MNITEVKITVIPNEGQLKAYASIVLDNCFVIHDLKVIRTEEKSFVAMPSKKRQNRFMDIAHPLDQKTRGLIQQAVFKEYEKTLQHLQSEESVDLE